jgi:hypothetical protein
MPPRPRRTLAYLLFAATLVGQIGCSFFNAWCDNLSSGPHSESRFDGVVTDPRAMMGGFHSAGAPSP